MEAVEVGLLELVADVVVWISQVDGGERAGGLAEVDGLRAVWVLDFAQFLTHQSVLHIELQLLLTLRVAHLTAFIFRFFIFFDESCVWLCTLPSINLPILVLE